MRSGCSISRARRANPCTTPSRAACSASSAPESTASIRLPTPLSEYCRRYPEVTLELRTGNGVQIAKTFSTATIDAGDRGRADPGRAVRKAAALQRRAGDHRRRRTSADPLGARRASRRPILVFEQGCPWRKRLEEWFARTGEMPERKIEITSYHAMLGCVVVGMGISLVPRMVLDTFPERHRLSVHPLPPDLSRAQTVVIWRKGARSPKLNALVEILDRPCRRRSMRARSPSSVARPRKAGGRGGRRRASPLAPGSERDSRAMAHYDVVVCGLGVMGSAALYHLARRGAPRARARSLSGRPRSRLLARRDPHHPPRLFRASVLCAAGAPRL